MTGAWPWPAITAASTERAAHQTNGPRKPETINIGARTSMQMPSPGMQRARRWRSGWQPGELAYALRLSNVRRGCPELAGGFGAILIGQGQAHSKGAAFVHLRFDFDVSAVVAHDPISNGESQAKPSAILTPGARFIAAIKAFEYMGLILKRDAHPCILHRKISLAFLLG